MYFTNSVQYNNHKEVMYVIEITIDLHELANSDETQQEIILNWNQKKLNTMLKGELIARTSAFAREVDEFELAVFNHHASLIILYKQDDFYKSLYKNLYKGRSYLKIDWNITSEIVVLSWETRMWNIEVVKI